MKKIDIKNRTNVTFLAKAYMDRLLTRAKKGEVFYEKNESGEISNIFFDDDYYTNVLHQDINNPILLEKINKSNAAPDWNNLIMTLSDYSNVDNLLLAHWELYTLVDEEDEPISYSEELLETLLSSKDNNSGEGFWKKIQYDLKRLFPALNMDVFKQEGLFRISFNIPIKFENEQRFKFKPIIQILNKYNMGLTDVKIFKTSGKGFLHISVFFDAII